MTLRQFLLEDGNKGEVLSHANSGSSAASLQNGTHVFDARSAGHGFLGAKLTNVAGSATYRRWLFDAPNTQVQFSGVFTAFGSTGAICDMAGVVNASGARRLLLRTMSNGEVRLIAGPTAYMLAAAGTVTAGEKIRVAFELVGGSDTSSSINAQLYAQSAAGNWTVPIGMNIAVTTANLTTDTLSGVEAGILTATASARSIGWDDLQLNDGAGGRISNLATVESPAKRMTGAGIVDIVGWAVSANGLDRTTQL